ncbi:MAG TPA: hypothetical protein VFG50_10925, partial [Rhodothermales bacterium]|nr:hypothetical protein [Rhodothermales bacterium]
MLNMQVLPPPTPRRTVGTPDGSAPTQKENAGAPGGFAAMLSGLSDSSGNHEAEDPANVKHDSEKKTNKDPRKKADQDSDGAGSVNPAVAAAAQ